MFQIFLLLLSGDKKKKKDLGTEKIILKESKFTCLKHHYFQSILFSFSTAHMARATNPLRQSKGKYAFTCHPEKEMNACPLGYVQQTSST